MKKKKNLPRSAEQLQPTPSVPAWYHAVCWAAVVWVGVTVFKFDERYPASIDAALRFFGGWFDAPFSKLFGSLLTNFQSLVLLAAAWIGVISWGSVIVGRSEPSPVTSLERYVLSAGVGAYVLSTLIFLLGIAGGYSATGLGLLLIVYSVSGAILARATLGEWARMLKETKISSSFATPVHWITAFLIAITFVMAFVPELFYDSLVYHLGLPQMFVNEGRIVDTANVYFSRFPMLMHMLYVMGVGLDGSSLAKLFNWAIFSTGLLGILCIGKRLAFERGAKWAILLLVAAPVVQLNIWATTVDCAMGTYTVLAFLGFLVWRDQPGRPLRWLFVWSLLAGCIFGVKYTGVVQVIAFGVLLMLYGDAEKQLSSRIRNGLIYSAMIVLVMAPWLVRNFKWTGNPTYPIMASVFESRHLNAVQVKSETELVARFKPRTPLQFLTFAWDQTYREISSFNFIGPMTLAGLPFLIFLPWRKLGAARDLVIVTATAFLVGLQFSGDIRYLLPSFYLLGLLLGWGIERAKKITISGHAARWAFFICGLYHTVWVLQVAYASYNPVPVLSGAVSRDDYSATMHDGLNLWPWNVMKSELVKLPKDARVYVLGAEQVAGFPRRFWYSSVHDYTPLVEWANASADAAAFYTKLKEEGFTHLMINIPETMRLKGYALFPWTDTGRENFSKFADQHLQLIDVKPILTYKQSVFLFEIKDTLSQPAPYGNFSEYFREVYDLEAKK